MVTTPAKLFEVRPSENKGLGVFATQFLPRGTRILSEKPLIYTTVGNYMTKDLEPAFNALTPEQQALFWTLHSGHGQDPKLWPSKGVDASVDTNTANKIREQHFARMAEDKSLLSVFMVNCMEMGNGAAVFVEAARFNHSCTPNAHFSWNERIGLETIHATKDIQPGEEIFLCYIDPIHDKAQRQYQLKHYGFQCHCEACEEPEPDFEDWDEDTPTTHATRRYRLFEIEEESTPSIMMYLLPDDQKEEQMTKKLKDELETIALYNEEGLYTPNLAMVYFDISTQCEVKEDYGFALSAAKKGLKVYIDCLGEDHDRVIGSKDIVKRLQEHLNSDGAAAKAPYIEETFTALKQRVVEAARDREIRWRQASGWDTEGSNS